MRKAKALPSLVLFALALLAGGQFVSLPVRAQDEDDEVVRVTTSEVLLPVTVRDSAGRLVASLKREDFRVWEDGREQPLSDLALRQVPVDVMLMVDASSSVAPNLEDFRRAAEEFASRLAPEDRVALIKFDDRVELLLDWTTSRAQLRRALRRLSPGMFTRFNDALYLAAREQFKPGQRRHAVVVLSDGIDSGRGHATLQTALRALLEAQAAVYCIANTEIERARKQAELDTLLASSPSALRFNQLRIGDLRESLRVLDDSERSLAALTEATGGRLYKPAGFDALDTVYREVADELRSQYALYYMPLDKTRDGKFRRVRVVTTDPNLRPSTRVGYFAPRN
ncbi:MAG TPA: VWA domain-containing protein [Pyrinomonadaceae bacterium]|nr:VWA domain-containing protein [Pyrinomonadaceae bacterium]